MRGQVGRAVKPLFTPNRTTFAHVAALCPSRPVCPTNDQTPTRCEPWGVSREDFEPIYFPVATNFPLSAFLNRDSFPFVVISLRIEL